MKVQGNLLSLVVGAECRPPAISAICPVGTQKKENRKHQQQNMSFVKTCPAVDVSCRRKMWGTRCKTHKVTRPATCSTGRWSAGTNKHCLWHTHNIQHTTRTNNTYNYLRLPCPHFFPSTFPVFLDILSPREPSSSSCGSL